MRTVGPVAALVALAIGCGGVAPHNHEVYDTRPLIKAQADALAEATKEIRGLRDEVKRLRGDIAKIGERFEPIEQRVGLTAFAPTKLKHLKQRETKLKTGLDAVVLGKAGAKGQKTKLDRYLAGYDGAVVAFWATWCVPCIADEELKAVKRLQAALAEQGVALVSLAIDELDSVEGHKKARRWVYPLWHRKNAHLEMLPKKFIKQVGVGLPLFVLVSRSGTIRWYHNQALDDGVIADLVTAAVREGKL